MIKIKNTTSQEVIVINDVKWSGEHVVSEKTAKGQKFIERVATMLKVKTTDAGEQYFVLRDGYEAVRGRNTTEKAQPKIEKPKDEPKDEPKAEPKAKDTTPKATPTPTKAKEDAPKTKTPKAQQRICRQFIAITTQKERQLRKLEK